MHLLTGIICRRLAVLRCTRMFLHLMNAPSIRIAADQNWMTGYLGGHFKPDQPVTMQEAARVVLALLGYTNTDYGSNISGSRMPLFYSLELNEELNRQETEVLNRSDCVNLFYNLLKAKNKSGTVYASVLGCELNSDGEVNPMGLADNSLKGPKLIRKGSQPLSPFRRWRCLRRSPFSCRFSPCWW